MDIAFILQNKKDKDIYEIMDFFLYSNYILTKEDLELINLNKSRLSRVLYAFQTINSEDLKNKTLFKYLLKHPSEKEKLDLILMALCFVKNDTKCFVELNLWLTRFMVYS